MKDLKHQVGERLRLRRKALGLSAKALAEASGLSVRYVLSAEHGQANLSLEKLDALSRTLDIPMAWLVSSHARGEIDALLAERSGSELAEVAAWLRKRFGLVHRPLVSLLGVRGAGKSTVGRTLAQALGTVFIELDQRIEMLADLSLAEIFSVHGESYYRATERQALDALMASGQPGVLATGGSIVVDPENYGRLQEGSTTIWLKARPEDHWDRVIQQGDRRPMKDHPHAMRQLRTLLDGRAALYGQADLTVDTSGRTVQSVTDEILRFLAEGVHVR